METTSSSSYEELRQKLSSSLVTSKEFSSVAQMFAGSLKADYVFEGEENASSSLNDKRSMHSAKASLMNICETISLPAREQTKLLRSLCRIKFLKEMNEIKSLDDACRFVKEYGYGFIQTAVYGGISESTATSYLEKTNTESDEKRSKETISKLNLQVTTSLTSSLGIGYQQKSTDNKENHEEATTSNDSTHTKTRTFGGRTYLLFTNDEPRLKWIKSIPLKPAMLRATITPLYYLTSDVERRRLLKIAILNYNKIIKVYRWTRLPDFEQKDYPDLLFERYVGLQNISCNRHLKVGEKVVADQKRGIHQYRATLSNNNELKPGKLHREFKETTFYLMSLSTIKDKEAVAIYHPETDSVLTVSRTGDVIFQGINSNIHRATFEVIKDLNDHSELCDAAKFRVCKGVPTGVSFCSITHELDLAIDEDKIYTIRHSREQTNKLALFHVYNRYEPQAKPLKRFSNHLLSCLGNVLRRETTKVSLIRSERTDS